MDVNTLALPPKRGCVYLGAINLDMRLDELPFNYTLDEFDDWLRHKWITVKFGKTYSAYDDAGCVVAAKQRLAKWRRWFHPRARIELIAVYQHDDASRIERRVLDTFNDFRDRGPSRYKLESLTLGYWAFLSLLANIEKQGGGRWIYDKTKILGYFNLLQASGLLGSSTTIETP